ncbi:MAG: hypothetical protein Q9159_007570 [Coniocarpon cinnabarinum]
MARGEYIEPDSIEFLKQCKKGYCPRCEISGRRDAWAIHAHQKSKVCQGIARARKARGEDWTSPSQAPDPAVGSSQQSVPTGLTAEIYRCWHKTCEHLHFGSHDERMKHMDDEHNWEKMATKYGIPRRQMKQWWREDKLKGYEDLSDDEE